MASSREMGGRFQEKPPLDEQSYIRTSVDASFIERKSEQRNLWDTDNLEYYA